MENFFENRPNLSFNGQTLFCPHAGNIYLDEDGCLIFSDGNNYDWNLIRIFSTNFAYKRVGIKLLIKPTSECNTHIYVNHWGGFDICKIDQNGAICSKAFDAKCLVVQKDDFLQITVEFFNCHPTLSIGTCRNEGMYLGSGLPQYLIKDIEVSIYETPSLEDKPYIITFADVGAMGGVHEPWRKMKGFIQPILFEPSPESAKSLIADLSDFTAPILVQAALADFDGEAELNITRHPGCSSLLNPNNKFLQHYRVAPIFEVVDHKKIMCQRFDTLHRRDTIPIPHILKIDVQGFEREVLKGFGDVLSRVHAIELEAHFYPIYKNQALIGELVEYLFEYRFILKKLVEQRSFDGDVVEFNAFFVRIKKHVDEDNNVFEMIRAIVNRVWNLSIADEGFELAKITSSQAK